MSGTGYPSKVLLSPEIMLVQQYNLIPDLRGRLPPCAGKRKFPRGEPRRSSWITIHISSAPGSKFGPYGCKLCGMTVHPQGEVLPVETGKPPGDSIQAHPRSEPDRSARPWLARNTMSACLVVELAVRSWPVVPGIPSPARQSRRNAPGRSSITASPPAAREEHGGCGGRAVLPAPDVFAPLSKPSW
jgi:hypothetical protein